MGFSVKDLLKMEIFGESKLLSGEAGLDNEILGATIIEAPDIVKFIDGGEILLTGFYAFQACSAEEFRDYMEELTKKRVSALAMKRGRDVKYIGEKIQLLLEFSERHSVPLLEVPFDLSFREILKKILERLFSEEVRRLKYFKTTHDNFSALSLSFKSGENGIRKILEVLEKLIGNPTALFNQNMDCLAATDYRVSELEMTEAAGEYQPQFFSSYTYLKQEVCIRETGDRVYEQYLVRLNLMYNKRMYLAVTALHNPFGSMEQIAVENALTALKQELFRQHTIEEVERKFQSDIMNNILNGKVRPGDELQKDIKLLGLSEDGSYQVLILNLQNDSAKEKTDLNAKMQYADMLYDAAASEFRDIKLLNDMDRVVVLQKIRPGQRQEEYRRALKKTVMQIQKRIAVQNPKLRVRAGVGKEVKGILNISESFKEAGDSLRFIDILGEDNADHTSRIMIFSDMGVFRLLCQLDSPQMLQEYIPESLQKLCDYKRQQRQDLLITLNTYLDRNQNLTRTAQELFIHYKTAVYRIERIAEITGIDFDNPSEVLAVRIGLIVYKMIENLKK